MTIAEQAKALLGGLQEWVQNNAGRAFVVADPLDCIEQLRMKPGVPSAAILWVDEDVHGEWSELGKVLRTFKIVVSRGRSMKIQPGESLIEGAAGGGPMFDVIEQAREIGRSLRMQDQQGEFELPVYKGSGPFEVNGLLLDASEIRIGLFADIPEQEGEAD